MYFHNIIFHSNAKITAKHNILNEISGLFL